MATSGNTLSLLLPETILVVAAAIIVVGGTFNRSRTTWVSTSVIGFVLAGLTLLWQRSTFAGSGLAESGPVLLDLFGGTMRWVALGLGLLFVMTIARSTNRILTSEAIGMVSLVFAGLMLVCWAGNFVLLLLGLELISIQTYVLLFIGRRDDGSAEATVKYFFLSILSSAIFMFGVTLLFGITGSMDLLAIREYFSQAGPGGGPASSLVLLAMIFMFGGLGFKIAAVPFHFYAPDVYQSTTNANAGLLAVVPKIAGMVALIRLAVMLFPTGLSFGWQLALVMSAITMTIGNICALWQNNIRRMMAYSSIAHAGYMLIGLAVGMASTGKESAIYSGFSASLLYLVVYAFASLGAFAVLCEISGGEDESQIDSVSQLAGMAKRRPWMAGALAVFMFSLAGIPPLAGFWGKMTLFTGALATANTADAIGSGANWFLGLAILGVLNAAIAAAYYLRIVGVTYFGEVETGDADTKLGPP
ncbi:MAG: NADH-quinone oxidoreductase subunit N, partial [Planctomycetota bacterium]